MEDYQLTREKKFAQFLKNLKYFNQDEKEGKIPELFFGGSFDNMSEFEKLSDNYGICVLDNSSVRGMCLVSFLRIILDNDLEYFCTMIFEALPNYETVGAIDITDQDIIKNLVDYEKHDIEIYDINTFIKVNLYGDNIVTKTISNIDIWNYQRVLDAFFKAYPYLQDNLE